MSSKSLQAVGPRTSEEYDGTFLRTKLGVFVFACLLKGDSELTRHVHVAVWLSHMIGHPLDMEEGNVFALTLIGILVYPVAAGLSPIS